MPVYFRIFSVGLFCVAALGCGAGKNKTNVEIFQGMMDQINIKYQEGNPDGEGGTVRNPPDHTVPIGYKPYKYAGDPLAAEKELVNPLDGDFSPDTVLKGKTTFEIYCMVCHGPQGHGDGPVAEKMALRPPSLVSEKVVNFRDGRIFHIISDGQGVMGSYASQIFDEKTRWAVVNYVRTLQKKNAAGN
ncbi:MAG: cytochrome c [Bdellovibrionales bacterium]|nr:cytochrome c [Bdellovibrionales bacterium]